MRPDLGYSVNLHKSKSIQTDDASDKPLQDWEMSTSGHVSDQPQPPVRDPLYEELRGRKKELHMERFNIHDAGTSFRRGFGSCD